MPDRVPKVYRAIGLDYSSVIISSVIIDHILSVTLAQQLVPPEGMCALTSTDLPRRYGFEPRDPQQACHTVVRRRSMLRPTRANKPAGYLLGSYRIANDLPLRCVP